MAKEYKNNIFDVLNHIDKKEYDYYESLSEEQQKDIQPYTITRWMSAVGNSELKHEQYTKDVNQYVNTHFWELSKYKDLQMKLLASCGQSGWNKHQWIPLSKNTPKDKNYESLKNAFKSIDEDDFRQRYESMDSKEIKEFLKMIED